MPKLKKSGKHVEISSIGAQNKCRVFMRHSIFLEWTLSQTPKLIWRKILKFKKLQLSKKSRSLNLKKSLCGGNRSWLSNRPKNKCKCMEKLTQLNLKSKPWTASILALIKRVLWLLIKYFERIGTSSSLSQSKNSYWWRRRVLEFIHCGEGIGNMIQRMVGSCL